MIANFYFAPIFLSIQLYLHKAHENIYHEKKFTWTETVLHQNEIMFPYKCA